MTRAKGRGLRLVELLERGGAEVLNIPLIEFEPTGVAWPAPRPGDVLTITSATAVEYLPERAREAWIAAVGPSTSQALQRRGFPVALCPERGLADALADALGDLSGRRVIYPRAERVPPAFEERLQSAGAEVVAVPVYRTLEPPVDALPPVEVIALASGSAARHLARLEHRGRIVAIGPSTAAVCRAVGLEVAAVASPHTSDGLAAAILELLA